MKNIWAILLINWKEKLRSPVWNKNLLINLILIASLAYMAFMLLFIGFKVDDVLLKIDERSSPLEVVNSILLYYFFFDLLLRYFMQKLPALSITPYLHLPVSRKSLVHFMLIKSALSPFNWMHLLLFVPFMIEMPFTYYTSAEAWGWSIGILSVIIGMNYLATYLKRTAETDTRVYIGLIVGLALLIGLDYFELVGFMDLSKSLFNQLFLYPITALIPLALAVFGYWFNFRYLRQNMYLSRITKRSETQVSYAGGGILSRFGLLGQLAELELKFIWRHKRTRSVLLITILFLGYGLIVFPNPQYDGNHLMYMLFSIIITGMFTMNYGQYLLGWEGSHFDHILSRNVSYRDYYASKMVVFALVSTACMLLAIPYVYFGWEILFTVFCVYLYNMGVSSFIVMFFGSFNPKKIDLSKGTVFNWQGVGVAQFLLIVPIMGIPMGILGLGMLYADPVKATALVGIVGLLGLAGTRYWLRLMGKWLRARRHEIAEDFRNI